MDDQLSSLPANAAPAGTRTKNHQKSNHVANTNFTIKVDPEMNDNCSSECLPMPDPNLLRSRIYAPSLAFPAMKTISGTGYLISAYCRCIYQQNMDSIPLRLAC